LWRKAHGPLPDSQPYFYVTSSQTIYFRLSQRWYIRNSATTCPRRVFAGRSTLIYKYQISTFRETRASNVSEFLNYPIGQDPP